MDAITLEKRYLRINKKLGMLTGVWPYQKSSPKWISRTVVLFVIIPCYVTQYARIVTFPRIHIILNDYPYLITSLGVIIKFGNYFINESELKYLLGKIYEDWRAMTSEDEYKIMTKYAEKGIFSVILYILHISLCAALFMCLPFVSPILDILMPLNETRARLFVYPAYYFVDEDKYRYLIVGHMYLVVVMLISVFCACDANYVYAVQHACGLLAIAGYRFKYACYEVIPEDEKEAVKMMKKMYRNVCHSIRIHQRALQYVKEITAAHDTCMFISVGLLMMSISTSLLQIANTVLFFSMDNLVDGIPFNVAAVGTFVKLGNYIINETKLKSMVEQIFDDWTSITSETECKIMVTYARKGQLIALCYAAHLFLPAAIFLCVPFAPIILDICAPLNKTRKRVFVYPAYYWMDPEQYYMIMIIHIKLKVVHGTFFVGQAFHVFFLNVQGQFVINAFDELYDKM
ncbi:hypothetical protein WH47_09661 [Habropoda laboriosa]|uniref:Odorant receptor n=1 Tax=Habropoda laboriosa TaxID=597456 RepID=A0A0L7QJH5_9HYME|nr:hypothetical protein WH47_09661 [Habropoda laboriosa]